MLTDAEIKSILYDTQEEAKEKTIWINEKRYDSFKVEETGKVVDVDQMPKQFILEYKQKYICFEKMNY